MTQELDHESQVPRNRRPDLARERALASRLIGVQEWIGYKERKVADLKADLERLQAQKAAIIEEMEALP